jgi:hypothetical protein
MTTEVKGFDFVAAQNKLAQKIEEAKGKELDLRSASYTTDGDALIAFLRTTIQPNCALVVLGYLRINKRGGRNGQLIGEWDVAGVISRGFGYDVKADPKNSDKFESLFSSTNMADYDARRPLQATVPRTLRWSRYRYGWQGEDRCATDCSASEELSVHETDDVDTYSVRIRTRYSQSGSAPESSNETKTVSRDVLMEGLLGRTDHSFALAEKGRFSGGIRAAFDVGKLTAMMFPSPPLPEEDAGEQADDEAEEEGEEGDD